MRSDIGLIMEKVASILIAIAALGTYAAGTVAVTIAIAPLLPWILTMPAVAGMLLAPVELVRCFIEEDRAKRKRKERDE